MMRASSFPFAHALFWCTVTAWLLTSPAAFAQSEPDAETPAAQQDSVEALRAHLRLPEPREIEGIRLPSAILVLPGTTINTPTGYGARWGQVYAGASVQDRIRYASWTDGVVAMGAGFGDPERWIGVDVTLHILDTYTDFAEDRAMSVKLHRQLLGSMSVAVGWENMWHTAGTDGGSSPYAVLTKATRLHDGGDWMPFGVVVATAGVGGDRFQNEDAFRRRENGAGVFGSLAVRLVRPVHAIANWTGQDLSLGLSITPIPQLPLVITPALMDVTGAAGDGIRFSASAALIYDFKW
jgi:hypothetical protein